jgi:molecular chaperone HtpG
MNGDVAKIELQRFKPRPQRISDEIVIGKDILELLTGGMYVDPLNVYREYIQNAADAIDEARDGKLENKNFADVQVHIDHQGRSIRIRDFGASIPASEFVRRLTAIGASGKRGTKLRGFRGIGRLSGLGYCQELVFRGRQNEEAKVMELRWDARSLRDRLRDAHFDGCLPDIVREIATVSELPSKDWPDRFFEVELQRVVRLRNDVLLNEEAIRRYLSQIAPVPFDPEFTFGTEIQTALSARGISEPLKIELNDGQGLVCHRACDQFPVSQKQKDVFRSVDFWDIGGPDGQPAAFGWVLDHSYYGAIAKRLGLGGIRLRAGNIQVGDANVLAPLFPEARFTEWVVGEIHVLSPKIVPNGRRDDFEPSMHYAHLQGELATHAKDIVQIVRSRSEQRSRLHRIHVFFQQVEAWTAACRRPRLHRVIRHAALENARKALQQASKHVEKLAPESNDGRMARRKLHALGSELPEVPPLKSARQPLNGATVAAIHAILASEPIPKGAIELASRVLRAIEKA